MAASAEAFKALISESSLGFIERGAALVENETWITRLLHNQIVYAIQRRLQLEGMQMVILPMQAPAK